MACAKLFAEVTSASDAVAAGAEGAAAGAATCAGAAACGAAAATGAAPATSNFIINEPVETLSPAFTKISLTTPANGAGTSIEALSPSTVINDCSSVMLSPTFTIISVTLTSSPPISGTFTSFTPPATGAAGAAAGADAAAAEADALPATSKRIINVPVDTLSPALIMISFTIPATGAGTSIDALSPSTLIMD